MSRWWEIFPWKFGKGSVTPALPCEVQRRCENIAEAGPLPLESDWVFGILLPLSFLGNVNVKSVCRVNMLWGLRGPLSAFHLKMDAVCLQPVQFPAFLAQTTFYLCVMFPLAYVPFVPLRSLNVTAHSQWQGNQTALTSLFSKTLHQNFLMSSSHLLSQK